MNAVLDHLQTNQLKPQPCTDGATLNVNGWFCHVRIVEDTLFKITFTPEKKDGNEHVTFESPPCSLREIATLIREKTATEPIRRTTRDKVEAIGVIGQGVRPPERPWAVRSTEHFRGSNPVPYQALKIAVDRLIPGSNDTPVVVPR